MTDREKKSMTWAGVLLLGAAAFRFLVVAPAPAEPPGRPAFHRRQPSRGGDAQWRRRREEPALRARRDYRPQRGRDEELDRLPGVDPARALQIVQNRRAGAFSTVEDLAASPESVRLVDAHAPFLRLGSARPEAWRPCATGTGAARGKRRGGVPGGGGLVDINGRSGRIQAFRGWDP